MSTTTKPFSGHDIGSLIDAGLVGVKLATLKQNPIGLEARPRDVAPLGIADDDVKRVYWFHAQLVSEIKSLEARFNGLISGLTENKSRLLGPMIVALCDGSKLEDAKQAAELELELFEKRSICIEVGRRFWAEAKRRIPELYGYAGVTLHNDWTFSGSDKPKSKVAGVEVDPLFEQMFRGLGGDSLVIDLMGGHGMDIGDVAGLSDLLERRFGASRTGQHGSRGFSHGHRSERAHGGH